MTQKNFVFYNFCENWTRLTTFSRVFDIGMIFLWRSLLITNGYHCWQVPSLKPLLSKYELHPSISLQVTVFESNQPPNCLQEWKKVNFVCWLWSLININRSLLRHMHGKGNGLVAENEPWVGRVFCFSRRLAAVSREGPSTPETGNRPSMCQGEWRADHVATREPISLSLWNGSVVVDWILLWSY